MLVLEGAVVEADGEQSPEIAADYRARQRAGRRPGPNETRRDILAAARELFSENGYNGVTMRVIAQKANVDAALIHHFFISKEGVFAAAVEDSFRLTELLDEVLRGSKDNVGERLVAGFLELWAVDETREPMLAIIRSAFSYEDAARLLRDVLGDQVIARLSQASDQKDARLRATLVGSQLIGIAILRYITKIEPLASADPKALAKFLGVTVNRYLYRDLDPPGASTQGGGQSNSAAEPHTSSSPSKLGSYK